MFGYVVADKPNMLIKDYYAYRAFYCGICVGLGKRYGQLKRFLTNFDVAFLAAFLHGYKGKEPTFKNSACILSPFEKKPIAKSGPLMEKLCDVTVLLAYYKITDNVNDEGKGKHKALKRILSRSVKKAKKNEPEIFNVINECLADLTALEKQKCKVIDALCEPFAILLGKTAELLCGKDENVYGLFYNLGRWIYVIDAIDDLEKDFKDGSFNPLLNAYGDYTDKQSFLAAHGEELTFLVRSAYNKIKYHYSYIPLKKFEGVVTNILWYGLLQNGEKILKGEKPVGQKMKVNVK